MISASTSGALEAADERRTLIVHVDREHTHVATAPQRFASEVRPAHHADGRIDRQHVELRNSGVGSPSISSARRRAVPYGSAAVSMCAQSHHSGPDVGWRSTMRRHATTRPAGSIPMPAQGRGRLADRQPPRRRRWTSPGTADARSGARGDPTRTSVQALVLLTHRPCGHRCPAAGVRFPQRQSWLPLTTTGSGSPHVCVGVVQWS